MSQQITYAKGTYRCTQRPNEDRRDSPVFGWRDSPYAVRKAKRYHQTRYCQPSQRTPATREDTINYSEICWSPLPY